MGAEKLADRVSFQRQAETPDGYGNVLAEWATYLTCWADVLERLGGEKLDAGRIEAGRLATIRVIFAPETQAIVESDRVQARGVIWNIRSIAQVGRHRDMLEMLCESGVAT